MIEKCAFNELCSVYKNRVKISQLVGVCIVLLLRCVGKPSKEYYVEVLLLTTFYLPSHSLTHWSKTPELTSHSVPHPLIPYQKPLHTHQHTHRHTIELRCIVANSHFEIRTATELQ